MFDAAFDDFTSCSTGDRFATLNAMTEFALQHQAHLARFAQVLEHSGSILSSVAKDLQYSSTANLLQHEVGFAKGQADAYVRLGKLLEHREYPVLAEAIEAGTVSSQQAIIIVREFDRQRDHFDAEFLAMADRSAVGFTEGSDSSQPWSPEDLRDSIRGWFAQHDPEQVELRTEQQHARRSCKAWVQEDGMVTVITLPTATDGAAVMQFLDANASPRTRLSAPDGDPEIDMRTREQKMADAFVQRFHHRREERSTPALKAESAPTLLVTVPMAEINKHANGTPALARVSRTQEFVPVAEVSRIICDDAVQAAITDDSGNVLKLGRITATVLPRPAQSAERRLPHLRDRRMHDPVSVGKRLTGRFRGKTGIASLRSRTIHGNDPSGSFPHHHPVHLERLKMTKDPQTQKWKAVRAIRR